MMGANAFTFESCYIGSKVIQNNTQCECQNYVEMTKKLFKRPTFHFEKWLICLHFGTQ